MDFVLFERQHGDASLGEAPREGSTVLGLVCLSQRFWIPCGMTRESACLRKMWHVCWARALLLHSPSSPTQVCVKCTGANLTPGANSTLVGGVAHSFLHRCWDAIDLQPGDLPIHLLRVFCCVLQSSHVCLQHLPTLAHPYQRGRNAPTGGQWTPQ